MLRPTRIALLLLVSLAGAPATAGVTARDVDAFLSAKPTAWGASPSDEVLKLLLRNLPRPGYAGAVRALATEWHVGEPAAALIAEAVLRETIDPLGGGDTVTALYLRAVDLDPSSRALWMALRLRLEDMHDCARKGVADRYFAREGAAAEYLANADTGCLAWITTYARVAPMTPLAAWRLYQHVRYDRNAERLAAAREFVLELREQGVASLDETAYARRIYWYELAQAGLSAALVEEGRALSNDLVQYLLDPAQSRAVRLEGVEIASRQESEGLARDLRLQWILALLERRGVADAVMWRDRLQLERPTQKAGNHDDGDGSELVFRLTERAPGFDPFDLFVGDGAAGLLWGPATTTPIATRTTMSYLREHGYHAIAADLRHELCRNGRLPPGAMSEGDWAALSPALNEARARFDHLIDEGAERVAACGGSMRQDASIGHLAARRYIERPLDPAQRTAASEDSAEIGAVRGLEGRRIVRLDTAADRWVAISSSQDVDPTGEIGAGGYWLHVSSDAGTRWRSFYLGLQELQPYVVAHRSKLPLIDQNVLRIEAAVRELDERTITFPPVGLRAQREAEGLFIECPLADIEKDTDGDGLTDVLEDKIRTDPRTPDTDGDGLTDDSDSLPQVSIRERPHADAAVIMQLMQHVIGLDAAAAGVDRHRASARVTFLKADRALFTGLMLPQPVVLLDDRDLAYLRRTYGVHYPIEFPAFWFNAAHTKAVVRWTAGWIGGTLLFTRDGEHWKSVVVSRWIT